MIAPEKRVIVWYHANCTDGLVAAWIALRALEKRGLVADAMPVSYEEFKDELKLEANIALLEEYKKGELYIVDFSLSIPLLRKLAECYPNMLITILDHHKTAFEMYAPHMEVKADSSLSIILHNAHIELDNAECGASLAWHFFNLGQQVPLLLQYVKDRDLWQGNYGEDTHILAHWLADKSPSFSDLDHICKRVQAQDPTLWEEAIDMYDLYKMQVEEAVINAVTFSLDGHRCLLTTGNTKKLASDVGSMLAIKSGTFGAYVQKTSAGGYLVSLRSRGEIDVSEIAKAHGGGGHKNAAGFELKATDPLAVTIAYAITDWEDLDD